MERILDIKKLVGCTVVLETLVLVSMRMAGGEWCMKGFDYSTEYLL